MATPARRARSAAVDRSVGLNARRSRKRTSAMVPIVRPRALSGTITAEPYPSRRMISKCSREVAHSSLSRSAMSRSSRGSPERATTATGCALCGSTGLAMRLARISSALPGRAPAAPAARKAPSGPMTSTTARSARPDTGERGQLVEVIERVRAGLEELARTGEQVGADAPPLLGQPAAVLTGARRRQDRREHGAGDDRAHADVEPALIEHVGRAGDGDGDDDGHRADPRRRHRARHGGGDQRPENEQGQQGRGGPQREDRAPRHHRDGDGGHDRSQLQRHRRATLVRMKGKARAFGRALDEDPPRTARAYARPVHRRQRQAKRPGPKARPLCFRFSREGAGCAAGSAAKGQAWWTAGAGSSATSRTSPIVMTGWKVICSRTSCGHVVEVGAVALGQDHVGQARRVRGEHLLLEPADRQHAALQRDLAGHADRVLAPGGRSAATRAPSSS